MNKRVLMVISFIAFSINCNNNPEPVPIGLRFIDGQWPVSYDQSSDDSLVITFKLSPHVLPFYVWFAGTCGRDSFHCYPVQASSSPGESSDVTVKWHPAPGANINTGQYKVKGFMDPTSMPVYPQYETGEAKGINIYDVCDTLVIASIGYQRSVRLDEHLNDTMAFRIQARLIDETGWGIINKTVTFWTNKGIFEESGSQIYVSTTTTPYVGWPGFAKATLKLNQYSGGIGGENYDYDVKASYMSGIFTVSRFFYERCISDGELSNIGNNFTHKRLNVNDPNTEMPGDNLPNNSAEDPNSNVKDIYVEVDYRNSINGKTESDLRNEIGFICAHAEYALERGKMPDSINFIDSGIDVHFVIDEPIGIDSVATKSVIKDKLSETRKYPKYIHCIIGSYCIDNAVSYSGVCLGYEYRKGDYDYLKRMFYLGMLSSSEVVGNDYLDSTGCYVAFEKIIDDCNTAGCSWTWQGAGVALAHEIGHAIGLEHTPATDGENIMKAQIEFTQHWTLDISGFFKLNRLHDSGDPDFVFALDLLNKLGIETVGLMDHAYNKVK